jgi:hypothetical protein
VPTFARKDESEPSVMPWVSSSTVKSGASSVTPRPSPIGPVISTPARPSSMASATGESTGPEPSGSLRKSSRPPITMGWRSPMMSWMMSPISGKSQRPQVGQSLKPEKEKSTFPDRLTSMFEGSTASG